MAFGVHNALLRAAQGQHKPAAPMPAAKPVAKPLAAPAGASPLPAGLFNPQREIEVEEANRGLQQLTGEAGTSSTRDFTDYNTALAALSQQEANQKTDLNTNLATIKKGYTQLASKQQQSANAAGAVSGGALLQGEAKRAANEGTDTAAQNTSYEREQQANVDKRAELALNGAPPPEPASLDPSVLAQGGREYQDLGTKLQNANLNNAFFGESQQRLSGQEAAENGYTPASALMKAAGTPAAPKPPTIVRSQPQAVHPMTLRARYGRF